MAPIWRLPVALIALALFARIRCEETEIDFSDAPDAVAWAVQISDLHVSVFHPNRAEDLEILASRFLALVRPALVLVTGDLTDAKNRDLSVTRQDEAEWMQYQKTMKHVSKESRLPQSVFFDLRGNHDRFGVPNRELDFFSRYSISADMNRVDPVQAATVTVPGGWKYLFLGFDDTMAIGLRGPTNLFGHPTDSMLGKMVSLLEGFEKKQAPSSSAKVAFGHFPMSFTASSESGRRPEEILARHGISAYLCGHLHTKFGKQLYRLHSYPGSGTSSRKNEFWEWEIGDWRGSRTVRVLSLDHGHTSFVDIRLDGTMNFTTIVLPTYPLDSRFMKRHPAYTGDDEDHGDRIRALVFSEVPITSAVAKVYDSKSGSLRLVDELDMQLTWGPNNKAVFYETRWRRNRYSDPSALRYWLEVLVTDSSGRKTASELRPFSVDGKVAELKWGFSEFLVMGVQWGDAYLLLFWLSIGLLAAVLLLPRLAYVRLKQKKAYKNFVSSVLAWNTKSGGSYLEYALKSVGWIFMEGSRNAGLWWGQLALVTWLVFLPWFWGYPFGDGHAAGYLSRTGWHIQELGKSGLASPDVLVIVLPFLYMVVLPLSVVIAGLSAERAACEAHQAKHCGKTSKSEGSKVSRKKLNEKSDSGLLQLLENEAKVEKKRCVVCSRWRRKALLAVCLLIGWLHWRQCYWVAVAFDWKWGWASPGFVWSVPVLMISTIFTTCGIRNNSRQVYEHI
ncbi:putative metallophosphoesterase At3g03305 [Selaginella moellendorffii]|uniref:putative metallophosphoesterase At3g03305 n=1 Tax=Selaginella moellendorffii TaxID=88036 RepID=UPI000D1CD843|nr:putative metallophosphoesterase At3g03305 [Selaginella moellendorffii]|eukprot:XP_024520040.1 putative metallophosphoesterase At3g03305 [Selaginella moellendorffii]